MLTSGVLSGLQELLASYLAHDVGKHGHYFSSRIPKMSLYGMFIAAPLGHVLIGILQKIFAGRTSLKAKILQILVSNLIVRDSFVPDAVPVNCDRVAREDEALTLPALPDRSPPSRTPSTCARWRSLLARVPSTRFAPPFVPVSCPS